MKKLCLSFLCALILMSWALSPADAASSKKKKKPTKKKQQTTAPAAQKPNSAPQPVEKVQRNHGIPRQKLADAYNYAKYLYVGKQYDKAKEVFKKLIIAATDSDISANSLYLYSQCSFHTEDYTGCVKALMILAKRWPGCPLIKGGYVSRFCLILINDVANVQTNWDYYRFKERYDEKGQVVWKESVPVGLKIKRINFRLGFGLFRVLRLIQPNDPQTLASKQKLDRMLNAPITMLWVDEKAPPSPYGHPEDFFSIFSTNEKKDFSKVICERMFFDWETDKLYNFLNMYDDVRNLTPRFVATSKPPQESSDQPVTTAPGAPPIPPSPASAPVSTTSNDEDPFPVLTLSKLFALSGYNPYDDSYTNAIENSPQDLNL